MRISTFGSVWRSLGKWMATSSSRKLLLALYFFFLCTLYTFLNLVYLPGPFNFYFLNLLQMYISLGFVHLSGSVWTSLGSAASACGSQVVGGMRPRENNLRTRNLSPRSEKYITIISGTTIFCHNKKHILKATKAQSNQND